MKAKFTIKDLLNCWLKLWPVVLALTLLGLGLGVIMASGEDQSYKSRVSILVVNSVESFLPTDYVGIINSPLVIDPAKVRAGIGEDADCNILAAGIGNVLGVTAECFSEAEDSEALAISAVPVIADVLNDIYGDQAPSVVVLSEPNAALATSSSGDYAMKVVVPAFVGLALSVAIAFVKIDYTTSKQKKK